MIDADLYNKTRTQLKGFPLRKMLDLAMGILVKDGRITKTSTWRVEVSFVGTQAIKKLSTHYYDSPRETDVISLSYFEETFKKSNKKSKEGKRKSQETVFVNLEPSGLAGEIFISVPYARKQARKIGQSLTEELKFLFVHGLLHVFGYDHMKPDEEAHMLKLSYAILGRKAI